jgi:hypothetical protein
MKTENSVKLLESFSLLSALPGNTCKLNYQVTTNPDPIQVSEEGNPNMTKITIVVSNGTDEEITCNEIRFSFDIGELAQNLTNDGKAIKTIATPSDGWQISSDGNGTFTAAPQKPNDAIITTDGLSFVLYAIEVNKQPGTFDFRILEKTNENGRQTIQIGKFPADFYVRDFKADPAIIDKDGSTALSWIGSKNATYTLRWEDNEKGIDVSNKNLFEISNLIKTTTFYLHVEAQVGGESIEMIRFFTVTINTPPIIIDFSVFPSQTIKM